MNKKQRQVLLVVVRNCVLCCAVCHLGGSEDPLACLDFQFAAALLLQGLGLPPHREVLVRGRDFLEALPPVEVVNLVSRP